MIVVQVINLTRPSITFEELEQQDGSYLPGRTIYHAISFSSKLDPFAHSGYHDEVTIEAHSESWKFSGVMLALAPQTGHRPSAEGYSNYVLIFSGMERLPDRITEQRQPGP